jgi:hypothetical protein
VPADSPRRRDRTTAIALAALLVWALALRVWFATPELHAGRFWDERYALENVEALLRDGRWLPVNAFHPTLAHLPQAAVLAVPHGLARATGDPAFAVLQEDGFTPLGYLLARLVQAVLGTLSIYWLFRVGRRLFDCPTGLLAAALLAVVPWHLRQSAFFKPDVLLLLLELVAFDWALAAYERPRTGRFARAGLGVGLAAAAKYNGVTAALPLAAGWLFGPGSRLTFVMRMRGSRFHPSARMVPDEAVSPIAGAVSRLDMYARKIPSSTRNVPCAGTPSSSKAKVPRPGPCESRASATIITAEAPSFRPRQSGVRKLVPA